MENPNDQSQLDYLLGRANSCLKSIDIILETLNRNHPVEGCRWMIWENQVDCVNLGDIGWDEFEEPNDPIRTKDEQEKVLHQCFWINEN